VIRLALIYAMADGAQAIDAPHFRAALALWDYCEQSLGHIFGTRLGDRIADAILDALRTSEQGLNRTEISKLFSGNKAANEINRALALLHQQGLAQVKMVSTTGRPIEVWFSV
jgi:hypothetical protein